MKAKRKILIALAFIVGGGDAGYMLWLHASTPYEMQAEWIAYMPQLEVRQRQTPYLPLNPPGYHDPEYPVLFDFDEAGIFSIWPKVAHDCKIKEYVVSTYFKNKLDSVSNTAPDEMPERLFLGALSPEMASCLRRTLPKGYSLARLSSSIAPRRVGWGEHDLQIATGP